MTVESHIKPPVSAMLDQMRAALSQDFSILEQRLADLQPEGALPAALAPTETGSALDTLALVFQLEPVERAILGLAAGVELDPGLAAAVTKTTGAPYADLSLALSLFGNAAWNALCPAAPLRRNRLVDLADNGPMLQRRLDVDERILQFLMGLNYLDARLEGIVREFPPPVDRTPASLENGTETQAVARIKSAWPQTGVKAGSAPVLMLSGPDPMATRVAFGRAAANLGMALFRINATDIPADWTQRHALAGYLDRELALSDGAVLIECGIDDGAGVAHTAARLADALQGPTAIAGSDPEPPERAPRLRIDISGPTSKERRALWHASLGPQAEALGRDINRLAEQFALGRAGVQAASESCQTSIPTKPDQLMGQLWQAAREQGRLQLDGLAQRIESTAAWEDLILPEPQMAMLRDLATHVFESWRISEDWGWRAKSPRGLGAAALFAGPSGTGKTFAAEVLASRLNLDLYRIDLSQVVSKYIGETEKNLSRIFAAAEHGGAILLFDEADALFGKRSEVKDSHDRYANVEVSYLLQRMEAYRGLAILTTNQKNALDSAFLRRLRCVVQFPFPDAAARAQIWARIFPSDTPLERLDLQRLARLNLSGGSIRSIALNASYLAAGQGSPVSRAHILTAVQREYIKIEKPFTSADMGALS